MIVSMIDAVRALTPCYNTIDLRVLVTREDQIYKALVLTIDFRVEPREQHSSKGETVTDRSGYLLYSRSILPIAAWEQDIVPCLVNGVLDNRTPHLIVTERIQLEKQVGFDKATCSSDTHENSQPCFFSYAKFGRVPNELLELLDKDCAQKGYRDLNDFVIEKFERSQWDYDQFMQISIPVPFDILSLEMNSKKEVIVKFVAHENLLSDLSFLIRYDQYSGKTVLPRNSKPEWKVIGSMAEGVLICPPPNIEETDDMICVEVVHKQLGQIRYRTESIKRICVKSGLVVSPLYRVLRIFDRNGSFENFLDNMTKSDYFPNKLDSNDLFEVFVSHFLTLSGFKSIWLGKKDTIVEHGGKRQIASADVLACRENSVLVVSCKTKLPDAANVIDTLAEAVKIIRTEINDPLIDIVPCAFVGQVSSDLQKRGARAGVIVLDSAAIVDLLKDAMVKELTVEDLRRKMPLTSGRF